MADTSIGRLVVTLGANSAQLVTEFNKTQKRSKTWADSVSSAGKTSAVGFGIAAVGAIGLSVAIVKIVNANADYIDSLAKTADKLDITTEKLQLMRYQGELSGVAVGVMDKSLEKMNKTVSEAAQGLGVGKRSIDELGLSAAELNAMKPDEKFKAIAEAMKAIANQGDRTRLALDIFGKGGSGMLTLMASDLAAVEARFESLGVGITRQQAAIVESYNDTSASLDYIFSSFGQKLTVYLAGPFDEVLKYIEEIVVGMGGMDPAARAVSGVVIDSLAGIVTGAGSVVESINEIKIGFIEAQLAAAKFENFRRNTLKSVAGAVGIDVENNIGADIAKYEAEIAALKKYNANIGDTSKGLKELAERIKNARAPVGTGSGQTAKTGITNAAITPANSSEFKTLISQYDKSAKAQLDYEKQIAKINEANITAAEKQKLLAEAAKEHAKALRDLTLQQKGYNSAVGAGGGNALSEQITGRNSKQIGPTFSKYARAYQDSIDLGDMEKAAHWMKEMQDRFQEIARTGLAGRFDMNAMRQYLDQSGAGIGSMGDSSKVSMTQESLTTALDNLLKGVNDLNTSLTKTNAPGTPATSMASVTFTLQGDGKDISGQLFGEPVFINSLTKFNDAYVKETARAVIR